MPAVRASNAAGDRRDGAPSWNNSAIVVQLIRDRMDAHGWATVQTRELPVHGPAPELEQRCLGLGVGLWR